MRNRFISIILILFLLALSGFNCSQSPVGEQSITILHTNDIHGSFLPVKATWTRKKPEPLIGGFLALKSHVENFRKSENNTLLLDAGDIMTGNLICNMEYEGVKGGALVHFMNEIGYEGMTIGNHEFDLGAANVRGLMGLAKFPVYSANLYTNQDHLFTDAGYHIYKKNGLRIGVIGIITEHLFDVLNADKRKGLDVRENAPIVEKIASEIDDKTDLIVVLSHCGVDEDKKLAEQLSRKVDVIVGGHSHTRLKEPLKVNGILIVQAGAKATNLGHLQLTVAGDTVKSYAGELVDLWADSITQYPEMAKEITKYQTAIDAQFGKVIGELKTEWKRAHSQESNIGDFLADCIRDYTGCEIGTVNSGGIRKDMDPGEITIRDIMEILPFENYVVKFNATGADIQKFVETNARKSAFNSGGILQISGISYRYKKSGDNLKVPGITINGKPLDPNKTYSVASMDFVAIANGEKYFGFKPENVIETGSLFTDVVIEIVKKIKIIEAPIAGRIKEL